MNLVVVFKRILIGFLSRLSFQWFSSKRVDWYSAETSIIITHKKCLWLLKQCKSLVVLSLGSKNPQNVPGPQAPLDHLEIMGRWVHHSWLLVENHCPDLAAVTNKTLYLFTGGLKSNQHPVSSTAIDILLLLIYRQSEDVRDILRQFEALNLAVFLISV